MIKNPQNLLDSHAFATMTAFLEPHIEARTHVVIHLSGAHAYGFPSPDSDLDMKAIHVERTERLLGLREPPLTIDRLVVQDGVELDYTSNEIGPVLHGLLRGNGNYFERIASDRTIYADPLLESLRPLAKGALSRRIARHYRGFADQQREQLREKPTVKRLLYVLRTALTGIHVLRTGIIEPCLPPLAAEYQVAGVTELIDRKRAGERTALDDDTADTWQNVLDQLFDRLERERQSSILPSEPENANELEAWLIDVRRQSFG